MWPNPPQVLLNAATSFKDDPFFTVASIHMTVAVFLMVQIMRGGLQEIAFYVKIFQIFSIIVKVFIAFFISRTYTNPLKVFCYILWWFSQMFEIFFIWRVVRRLTRTGRVVNNSISVHPTATSEELAAFDDLCAICMAEMVEATVNKRLPCSHIFHHDCLQPWLLVRRVCPTCDRGC